MGKLEDVHGEIMLVVHVDGGCVAGRTKGVLRRFLGS